MRKAHCVSGVSRITYYSLRLSIDSKTNCVTCFTFTLEPVRLAPHSNCSKQPGFAVTTTSAPVAAMSKDLLDRKMDDVKATGAEVVVSANPGCLLQLEWGAKRTGTRVQVKHVTQVLLEAIEDKRNT